MGLAAQIPDRLLVQLRRSYGDSVTAARLTLLKQGNYANAKQLPLQAEEIIIAKRFVMDGCDIGEECIIGAGSVVTKGTKVPPGSLVLGSPARVVRSLSDQERLGCRRLALKYVALAKRYRITPVEKIACSAGWP